MQIAHRETARTGGAAAHRGGGIGFTYLLDGNPAARDNFSLSIVQFDDEYSTPRHRHNFEQIRVMLDGEFSFGPGRVQRPGSIGYFCEGGPYTQKGVGRSTMLLLQLAGPGGEPYMNHDAVRRGGEELAARGRFENGVYTWLDDAGRRHNQDGYEAVWQHVIGRPVSYCAPRYADPLIIDPQAFAYLPLAAGVEARTLGVFNERGTAIRMLRLAEGARWEFHDAAQGWIFFALAGAGLANDQAWQMSSAFHVEPDEQLVISASTASEIYAFGLPSFSDERLPPVRAEHEPASAISADQTPAADPVDARSKVVA